MCLKILRSEVWKFFFNARFELASSFIVKIYFFKVWSADSLEFVRTLSGHKRGIACLQYRGRLVVSGSSDNTIRYIIILIDKKFKKKINCLFVFTFLTEILRIDSYYKL